MSTTAMPIVPTFFLAGAPKAGTTSLYHHLRQHPEIYMSPVKEPSYFSFEVRLENFALSERDHLLKQIAIEEEAAGSFQGITAHRFFNTWEEYLELFARANGAKAIGEASVGYLWSRTAAREIAARTPRAKLLFILRHPAERAFSHYIHGLSSGQVSHSFRDHIAKGLRASRDTLSIYHPFLDAGFYGEHIERYFACFCRQQVRIWLYEDTLADPAGFLRQVLTFLDVDPNFTPDASRRFHEMEVPKALPLTHSLRRTGLWRAMRSLTPGAVRPLIKRAIFHKPGALKMNAEDRRFLVEYYHDDIRRLEHVIERDLSHWLR